MSGVSGDDLMTTSRKGGDLKKDQKVDKLILLSYEAPWMNVDSNQGHPWVFIFEDTGKREEWQYQ